MKTIDPDTVETKFAIADVATDLYIKNNGQFLIKDVARAVDMDSAEVFNFFPNKQAILEFYYTSLVFRYHLMIDEIKDFDSYSLSEKFSNFAYASFDMMDEKQAFVEDTFESLILHSYAQTDFEKEIEYLIRQFLETDARLSASSALITNEYLYAFLRHRYLGLVRFRISDTSEGQELTMELTDKLTSFLQELMYNAVADQGFELGKFIYANKKTFLQQIPVIRQIVNKIEIR